jgi:hypothetical protein
MEKAQQILEEDNPNFKIKQHLEELFTRVVNDKLNYNKKTLSNDMFLFKYIYLQIDVNKFGVVSRNEIYEYLKDK